MAMTSGDDYLAAAKQYPTISKTGARTLVAGIPFSMFDIAGQPGAGTLAAGNTANGIVPDDTLAGYPPIDTLAAIGYLTISDFSWSVAGRLTIYDRLFSAGAYAFNDDITLAAQPSYAARLPGTDYKNLQLWIETVTAFTGNPSFQINYLDEGGAAGDTGVVGSGAALTIGRMFRLPLAAGDAGVSQIVRVRGTVASVGTFNVNVMRRLWSGRVMVAGGGDTHDLFKTGARQVYGTSALFMQVTADGTGSGISEVAMEISDK